MERLSVAQFALPFLELQMLVGTQVYKCPSVDICLMHLNGFCFQLLLFSFFFFIAFVLMKAMPSPVPRGYSQ